MAYVNPRQVILQLSQAEPILVKAAEQLVKNEYFYPAIKQMEDDFNKHVITQEIEGGIESPNISRTMFGFRQKYSDGKNLFSFIGFNAGSDPLRPIRARMNPTHDDGPKYRYIRGSQVRNMVFSFVITAPDLDAIYDATPAPRFNGDISWAQRVEMGGIPGISQFLNKLGIPQSKSGGGVQVNRNLRKGTFKTRPYLTEIFGDFLAKFK